ncbi:MAG: type II toxin-antitoxin system ParD family antitoxin [Fimbriimonadaceae bacterium]|nr:type II toxin-antitoxin system ParD family antitoxin [Fimbriimonadaceae bacterium]
MDLAISQEVVERIRLQVKLGRFASESEVVSEGLRLIEERERSYADWVAETKVRLQEGLDDADQGRLISGEDARRRVSDACDQLRNRPTG